MLVDVQHAALQEAIAALPQLPDAIILLKVQLMFGAHELTCHLHPIVCLQGHYHCSTFTPVLVVSALIYKWLPQSEHTLSMCCSGRRNCQNVRSYHISRRSGELKQFMCLASKCSLSVCVSAYLVGPHLLRRCGPGHRDWNRSQTRSMGFFSLCWPPIWLPLALWCVPPHLSWHLAV